MVPLVSWTWVSYLNRNQHVTEVLEPYFILFLQCIPGTLFEQDNTLSNIAKDVQVFFSAQQIQPLFAYSSDMSPTEHVWCFVGRRLTCDARIIAYTVLWLNFAFA